MVPSFTFDLSCPGWQNHSPSYNFTIHTSGSNHKPLKSVAHESSQTMAVGNTSGVWICWARDNENCASAPAVTRTSCASNWFRGRWRGNVKFYYLTHLSWFMIVISTRRGSTLSTYWWAVLVFTVSQSIRSGRWEWIRAQNAWQGWYLLGTYKVWVLRIA